MKKIFVVILIFILSCGKNNISDEKLNMFEDEATSKRDGYVKTMTDLIVINSELHQNKNVLNSNEEKKERVEYYYIKSKGNVKNLSTEDKNKLGEAINNHYKNIFQEVENIKDYNEKKTVTCSFVLLGKSMNNPFELNKAMIEIGMLKDYKNTSTANQICEKVNFETN